MLFVGPVSETFVAIDGELVEPVRLPVFVAISGA